MKKTMRKTILLCGLLLLTGCAQIKNIKDIATNDTSKKPVSAVEKDTKEKTVICTGSDNEQVTLTSKGDKLQSMTDVINTSEQDMGIDGSQDSQTVQDAINTSLADKYNSIEGVSASGALKDDGNVQVTIQIDFSKANKQDLINAGLLQQGEKDSDVISLKETQKAYTSNGYACNQQ